MIRIICGTCGTSAGLKTSADGYFSLPAGEERRLVERHVAEYAMVPAETPIQPVATDCSSDFERAACVGMTEDKPSAEGLKPAYLHRDQLMEMKFSELKEMAAGMGIDVSRMRSKAEVAEAIAATEVYYNPNDCIVGHGEDVIT